MIAKKSRWRSAEEYFVALSLSTTIATQFRIAGLGFGLCEVLVGLWAIYAVIVRIGGVFPLFCRRGIMFVGLFFLAYLIGTTRGVLAGFDLANRWHDVFAVGANMALVIALLMTFNSPVQGRTMFIRMGLFLLVINALAGVLAGNMSEVGSITLRAAESDRLYGFSNNPNQIGMAASISLCAVMLADFGRNWWSKPLRLMLLSLAIYVGHLTGSDSFVVALCSFAVVYVVAKILIYKNISSAKVSVAIAVVVFMGMLGCVLFAATDLFAGVKGGLMNVYYADDNQGSVRFKLWENGVRAIIDSGGLGLGPGAFSGLGGPYEDYECHNSLIDVGTNTGILGMVLLCALFIIGFSRSFPKAPVIAAFLVMLFVHMFFNYFLRHFVFWAGLTFLLIAVFSDEKHVDRRMDGR